MVRAADHGPGKLLSVAGKLLSVGVRRSGSALAGTATTYRMTAASAAAQVAAGNHVAPVRVGQNAVSGTSMLAVLPALSVTTIAVQ